MCGIAGFQGSFSADALGRANSAIAHRGPDADGMWVDPRYKVGLAHRRLSIIDLSPSGAQPMRSNDGALVLAYNGEIYNFRELKDRLLAEGHEFRGTSDTEVLLHLYESQGEAMLPLLNGIFSFALWDARRESLLLARDGLGVKPLYYGASPAGLAFASEIKALLHLLPGAREVDPAALHRYLSFQYCPGEGTPLKGVRKLAPGEAVMVRRGAISRQWRWYELPAIVPGADMFSPEQTALETASMLRTAVHRQMVADVPVGAFLSGGLDSSAVVCFAREVAPEMRCFTIEVAGGQEPGVTDDLPYARAVARHLKVPLDVVRVDSEDMAKDFERMVAQLDEPLGDPAALNVLYITGQARAAGMKVLLSGAGGDDVYSGYRRHAAVRLDAMTSWIPKGVRRLAESASARGDQRNPVWRRAAKFFRGAGLQGDARLVGHFHWASNADLIALYSPQVRAQLGACDPDQPMLQFLQGRSESAPLDRLLTLEQRFFLADHNLIYTDKMSMANGVEVRVPFLDLELLAHAARIPHGMKQRGRVGKWILKRAMEPYLPREIIYRPKSGFGAPLRRWLRHDLRPLMADVLSKPVIERRGLFDADAVASLVARNENGSADAAYTLFGLMSIEIWCRAFLDGLRDDYIQGATVKAAHEVAR